MIHHFNFFNTRRFINKRYTIVRYPLEIGRYYMAKHSKDKNLNTERFKLLADSKKRQHTDGLNSIKYRVVSTELNPFYTKIKVSYDKAELRKSMVHNYHSQMRIVKSWSFESWSKCCSPSPGEIDYDCSMFFVFHFIVIIRSSLILGLSIKKICFYFFIVVLFYLFIVSFYFFIVVF